MDGFAAIARDLHQIFAMGGAADAGVEDRAVDAQDHAFFKDDIGLLVKAAGQIARLIRMGQADAVWAKANVDGKACLAQRFLAMRNDFGKAQAGLQNVADGLPAKAAASAALRAGGSGSPTKTVRAKSP